jgi:hypothetical protein
VKRIVYCRCFLFPVFCVSREVPEKDDAGLEVPVEHEWPIGVACGRKTKGRLCGYKYACAHRLAAEDAHEMAKTQADVDAKPELVRYWAGVELNSMLYVFPVSCFLSIG